ncbi:DNA-directed RNA polymerase [Candidatus Woesearchaeota archaeon]|nr:DNA-directed RNA polymerase [Candidatus Woesearchaeota archaeon]
MREDGGFRGKREGGFGRRREGGFGRGDRGGFRGDRGPREEHEVTCAECGKKCKVPFKPKGDRPVYCQECYRNKKPQRPRRDRY